MVKSDLALTNVSYQGTSRSDTSSINGIPQVGGNQGTATRNFDAAGISARNVDNGIDDIDLCAIIGKNSVRAFSDRRDCAARDIEGCIVECQDRGIQPIGAACIVA